MHDLGDHDFTSLEGSVEEIDGQLGLMLPLAEGGEDLIECSRGIGKVVGTSLQVIIPHWLAEKLAITTGMTVIISNENGKFNLYPLYGDGN